MCIGCWERYGSPKVVNNSVLFVLDLVSEVYEFSLSGGSLHVVLDDWNVEDRHLFSCYGDLLVNEFGVSVEQLDAEFDCLFSFMRLSIPERVSALALYEGCFEIPEDMRRVALDNFLRRRGLMPARVMSDDEVNPRFS